MLPCCLHFPLTTSCYFGYIFFALFSFVRDLLIDRSNICKVNPAGYLSNMVLRMQGGFKNNNPINVIPCIDRLNEKNFMQKNSERVFDKIKDSFPETL